MLRSHTFSFPRSPCRYISSAAPPSPAARSTRHSVWPTGTPPRSAFVLIALECIHSATASGETSRQISSPWIARDFVSHAEGKLLMCMATTSSGARKQRRRRSRLQRIRCSRLLLSSQIPKRSRRGIERMRSLVTVSQRIRPVTWTR